MFLLCSHCRGAGSSTTFGVSLLFGFQYPVNGRIAFPDVLALAGIREHTAMTADEHKLLNRKVKRRQPRIAIGIAYGVVLVVLLVVLAWRDPSIRVMLRGRVCLEGGSFETCDFKWWATGS